MRIFFVDSSALQFARTRDHQFDCLLLGNAFSGRNALKLLSAGYPNDVPPPEPPMKSVPDPLTDVPVPEPFDIPVPEPMDVPVHGPRDVPPPKPRPEIEPVPKKAP